MSERERERGIEGEREAFRKEREKVGQEEWRDDDNAEMISKTTLKNQNQLQQLVPSHRIISIIICYCSTIPDNTHNTQNGTRLTSVAMASSGPRGIFAFSVEGRRTMLLLREGWSFDAI